MRFPKPLLALAGVFLIATATVASAQDDEDEAPERSLTLDAATVARLGIETAPVQTAQYRAETSGFAVVMAFDALAQADADLSTAESATATSQAALTRARGLFAADVSISRQAVEAAERQSAADAAQLALAQRRSVTVWGRDAPWRTPLQRSQYLARLASGELVLARVTFPASAVGDNAPASLRVQRVGAQAGARSWTATTIWDAPADPSFPGRSFFALVEAARGLTPGERLLVSLPSGRAQQQGVVIPAAAVLIAEGKAWYYAAEIVRLIIPFAPYEDFTRQMLDLGQPTADGYFVPGGTGGQVVVVEGAGLLLASETGKAEDED